MNCTTHFPMAIWMIDMSICLYVQDQIKDNTCNKQDKTCMWHKNEDICTYIPSDKKCTVSSERVTNTTHWAILYYAHTVQHI